MSQSEPAKPSRTDASPGERVDCRCDCGNLLARRGPTGVELKCRRCKRLVVIAAATLTGEWTAATSSPCAASNPGDVIPG